MTLYRQNQEESNKKIWSWSCTQITPKLSHFGKHPNINDLCNYLNAGASRNGHVCILKCGLVGRNRGVYFFRNIHPWGRNWGSTQRSRICEGSQIVLAHGGNDAELILKMTKRCYHKMCLSQRVCQCLPWSPLAPVPLPLGSQKLCFCNYHTLEPSSHIRKAYTGSLLRKMAKKGQQKIWTKYGKVYLRATKKTKIPIQISPIQSPDLATVRFKPLAYSHWTFSIKNPYVVQPHSWYKA